MGCRINAVIQKLSHTNSKFLFVKLSLNGLKNRILDDKYKCKRNQYWTLLKKESIMHLKFVVDLREGCNLVTQEMDRESV